MTDHRRDHQDRHQAGGPDEIPSLGSTGAAASISDGGTINHGLAKTPAVVVATGSVAGEFVSVTAVGATNFTVAIRKHDGTAGTAQTVYWRASA